MAWPAIADGLARPGRSFAPAVRAAPTPRSRLIVPTWRIAGTTLAIRRSAQITTVVATSRLSPVVYFHWYLDGVHVASTTANRWSVFLATGDQARIECVDTNDPDFDPIANAPSGYPARRKLQWVRSDDANITRYRVEQQLNGGSWNTIGLEWQRKERWAFTLMTPRLTDLGVYHWRIIPIDKAGNDGTPRYIGPETVVRTPDGVDFYTTYASGTQKVTFTEVA